jgi:CBS-domain-containing membrane protein
MRKLRVRDVMTGGALSVAADTRLRDVADAVAKHHVDSLAVVDFEGVVVGVVERVDVARLPVGRQRGVLQLLRGVRGRPGGWRVRAGDVMSWPPLVIGLDSSALEAAHILVRHGIGRLPVVDDERRPIGSVSAVDLLREFMRPDAELAEQVVHEVFVHALGLGVSVDCGDVTVKAADGVVTLHGELARRSMVLDAVRLAAEVEGVARVVDRLTFAADDTAPPPAATP